MVPKRLRRRVVGAGDRCTSSSLGAVAVRPVLAIALFALVAGACGASLDRQLPAAANHAEPSVTDDQFRVAFFADTGYANLGAADLRDLTDYTDRSLPLPARVLKLVRAEGADLSLHGGDLGYDEGGAAVPEKWDRMVTQILGPSYPLFASGGNHDQRHWVSAPSETGFSGLGYRDVLRRRYEAVERTRFGADLVCSFANGVNDIGQRASCGYRDTLTFITVGLGAGNRIPPTEFGQPDNAYESYLRSALASSLTPWTVCNWHFNQTLFQTGFKTNEAGWKPYEYCRDAGALIATGHEHAYSRTHLMKRFAADSNLSDVASTASDLTIAERRTIAWVSGLGGKGIRTVSTQASNPWWAAKVNATNLVTADGGGVLFCDFSTSNNAHAECFYKTVDGVVRDRFRLVSNANGASGTFGGVTPATSTTTTQPGSTSTTTLVTRPTTTTSSTTTSATTTSSTTTSSTTASAPTSTSPVVAGPTSSVGASRAIGPVATLGGDAHPTRSPPQQVVPKP